MNESHGTVPQHIGMPRIRRLRCHQLMYPQPYKRIDFIKISSPIRMVTNLREGGGGAGNTAHLGEVFLSSNVFLEPDTHHQALPLNINGI